MQDAGCKIQDARCCDALHLGSCIMDLFLSEPDLYVQKSEFGFNTRL